MIDLSNHFTQDEKKLLNKLYDYYSEYGEIANIEEWEEDLNIQKEILINIAAEMYRKGWLKYFQDNGSWGGIQAGISIEGMRVIGKKPIDFKNQVKHLKCNFLAESPNMTIVFFNNREEKYFFAPDELLNLIKYSKIKGYGGYISIYEWIQNNRMDLYEIISKYNNSHKVINYIIDEIKKNIDFYIRLSEDEKKVYDDYKENTNQYASKLNAALRKNNIEDNKKIIAILDEIIRKYRSEESIKLYRATSVNYIDPFIKDNEYINKEYLSTTLNKEKLRTFFRYIEYGQTPAYVEIECPSGTSMAPMESNESHGEMESEMLLGRENKFEIVEIREEKSKNVINDIMGRFYGKDYDIIMMYFFNLKKKNEPD